MSLPVAGVGGCTELSASPPSQESLRRLPWCTCVSASARQSRASGELCCKIPAATLTPRRLAARSPFAHPLAPDLLPPRDPPAATLASPSRHLAARSLLSVPRLSVILPLPRRPCSSLPCRSFLRAAPPLPFSPPPPLPSVTAVPPYSATPRAVCPAVRCPACRLLPPRRLTADPCRLTFCSTEFALMSEPSRRVPRSGLAGPEDRPARLGR